VPTSTTAERRDSHNLPRLCKIRPNPKLRRKPGDLPRCPEFLADCKEM
jgi:hypothetical protein